MPGRDVVVRTGRGPWRRAARLARQRADPTFAGSRLEEEITLGPLDLVALSAMLERYAAEWAALPSPLTAAYFPNVSVERAARAAT